MARTRVVDDDGCVVPPLTDVQGSADQGEERFPKTARRLRAMVRTTFRRPPQSHVTSLGKGGYPGRCRTSIGSRSGADYAVQRPALDPQEGKASHSKAEAPAGGHMDSAEAARAPRTRRQAPRQDPASGRAQRWRLSPGQTLGHWCQWTLGHHRHVRH